MKRTVALSLIAGCVALPMSHAYAASRSLGTQPGGGSPALAAVSSGRHTSLQPSEIDWRGPLNLKRARSADAAVARSLRAHAGNTAPHRNFKPARASHSPSHISGADLAITTAPFTSEYNANVSSIDSSHVVFSHSHPAGYQDLFGGVGESAEVGAVTFLYQGSIFNSAASAQAAYTDGTTTVGGYSPVDPVDCSNTFGHPCQIIAFEGDGNNMVVYSGVLVNYCLVETEAYAPDATYTSLETDISKVVAGYTVEAVQLAETVCTGSGPAQVQPAATPVPPTATPVPPTATPVPPTEFTVTNVHLEQGKAGSGKTQPRVSTTKVGKRVNLVVLLHVTSGRGGSPVTVGFTVKQGSRTVAQHALHATLRAPDPTGDYRATAVLKMGTAGTYKFVGQVSIDGITQTRAATFTVTR